jgi:hypothetical protein
LFLIRRVRRMLRRRRSRHGRSTFSEKGISRLFAQAHSDLHCLGSGTIF